MSSCLRLPARRGAARARNRAWVAVEFESVCEHRGGLILCPSNAFLIPKANDPVFLGPLLIEGDLVNSSVRRIADGIQSPGTLLDRADLLDESSCDRAFARSEADGNWIDLERAIRVVGIRGVPFAD